jgi:16S rRNA (cytosine1402-N4)-methyltransferase
MHTPVLLNEVINGLNLKKRSIIIDGTLGFAGHAKTILEYISPNGLLIGIDTDTRNLIEAKKNLSQFKSNTRIIHDNFKNIKIIMKKEEINKVDGILLDLGISSAHVDEADRGFSFQADGPLDMRLNPEQELNASTIVNGYTEIDLANIIYEYGEERMSRKIARAIIQQRKIKKITRTRELAIVIEQTIPKKHKSKHPALLTFQALRIAVNNELNVLKQAIEHSVELLNPGGRLAVISYHSLEDRIVKHFFRHQARHCICPKELLVCSCNHSPEIIIINKRPICPSSEEVFKNPRSRSGKLRIIEKI